MTKRYRLYIDESGDHIFRGKVQGYGKKYS